MYMMSVMHRTWEQWENAPRCPSTHPHVAGVTCKHPAGHMGNHNGAHPSPKVTAAMVWTHPTQCDEPRWHWQHADVRCEQPRGHRGCHNAVKTGGKKPGWAHSWWVPWDR